MRCKTCHYSLKGLTGPPHRCPECGTAFDPNDADRLERQRQWRALWRALAWLIGTFLTSAIVLYLWASNSDGSDDYAFILKISLVITALVSPMVLIQFWLNLRDRS